MMADELTLENASLTERLDMVRENIRAACRRAGRDVSEVELVAVSKTKPVSDIQVVYDAGIREFGENKVQEMNEKQAVLPSDINWHMIGHLQRNKVKNVVGTTKLIHSVDSIRLAEEISREAQKKQCVADILLEVNVAGEETKFGFTPEETLAAAEEVGRLPGLHVKGLMTSAPFVENAEENRKYFRKLRELAVDIRKKNIDNVDMVFLSMGMTNDYAVAVEEGATHVRVGTAIFGSRNYSI
jgi:pyridoxal phosphate enzyme (YggS family)